MLVKESVGHGSLCSEWLHVFTSILLICAHICAIGVTESGQQLVDQSFHYHRLIGSSITVHLGLICPGRRMILFPCRGPILVCTQQNVFLSSVRAGSAVTQPASERLGVLFAFTFMLCPPPILACALRAACSLAYTRAIRQGG